MCADPVYGKSSLCLSMCAANSYSCVLTPLCGDVVPYLIEGYTFIPTYDTYHVFMKLPTILALLRVVQSKAW